MKKPIYKTVSIKANMAPIMKKVTKNKKVGTKEVKKTKGFWNTEEYTEEEPVFEEYDEMLPTGKYSNTSIDIEEFSYSIMESCNQLFEDGYQVINISDITSGRYAYDRSSNLNGAGWGFGYGYSVTDGVIITAKLKDL